MDGPTAATFVLSCVKQRLLSPGTFARLQRSLNEIAKRESAGNTGGQALAAKQAELRSKEAQLKTVERNMAFAQTKDQYDATASVFEDLRAQIRKLEQEIAILTANEKRGDLNAEVGAAIDKFRRLTTFAEQATGYEAAGELFGLVNARLFTRFKEVEAGKRKLNKLASGVVTFGAAPPPIKIYEGPTSRGKLKGSVASESPPSPVPTGLMTQNPKAPVRRETR